MLLSSRSVKRKSSQEGTPEWPLMTVGLFLRAGVKCQAITYLNSILGPFALPFGCTKVRRLTRAIIQIFQ
jgi:hypothetical protein